MKRFFATMLAIMMIGGMFVINSAATVHSPELPGGVISPEYPGGVDSPEFPGSGVDSPEFPGGGDEDVPGSGSEDPGDNEGGENEDDPMAGIPTSPQTGYTVGIMGLSAAAAACGAAAVIAGKKANKR